MSKFVVAGIALLGAVAALAAPPKTIEDLKALYPPLADDANGAPMFLKAAAALVKQSPKAGNMLPYVGNMKTNVPVQKLDDDRMALMAGHLAQNLPALEILRAAAAFPQSRFPVDFDDAEQGRQFDRLAPLRELVRLTSLKALFDSLRQNDAAAVEAVTLGMAVANSITDDPMVMSHLVRFALHSMTIDAMEQVINRRALTEPQLAALQRLMVQSADMEPFARGVEAEMCIGANMKFSDAAAEVEREKWLENRQALPDAIRALAKSAPMPDSTAMAPEPADKSILTACKGALARLRLASTLLGLERYRAAKGGYPKTLAELVPDYLSEIPIDPYDGQPLRYKPQDGGVFVWSVFQNGVDDGCNFNRFAKSLDLALVVFRD